MQVIRENDKNFRVIDGSKKYQYNVVIGRLSQYDCGRWVAVDNQPVIDAINSAIETGSFAAPEIAPAPQIAIAGATPKQIAFLAARGIDAKEMTKSQASKLISGIIGDDVVGKLNGQSGWTY